MNQVAWTIASRLKPNPGSRQHVIENLLAAPRGAHSLLVLIDQAVERHQRKPRTRWRTRPIV
jgi:hypothetical protein